jgi:uncharacterized membrane protein HdeD (DUF308 family)
MSNELTKKSKNANLWLALIKGILMIVFGVWLLQSPNENLQKLSMIFGLLILAGGLLEISLAFNNRKTNSKWEWTLISGVFDILIGAFLMANPDFLLLLITLLISFWLFFRGVLLLRTALSFKRANNKNYIYPLIFGILLIVIAVIFVWHPEVFGITLAFWTALAFISVGLFRIFLVFKFSTTVN